MLEDPMTAPPAEMFKMTTDPQKVSNLIFDAEVLAMVISKRVFHSVLALLGEK